MRILDLGRFAPRRMLAADAGGGGAGAGAGGAGAGGAGAGGAGAGAGGAGVGGAGAGGGDAGGQTGGAPSWDAALDPAQRQLAQTKGWKTPADVLRDYGQLEGLVGRDKVALPGKDGKPEDWAKVWNALGRPESPDKYDLGDFKPPEGLPWNNDAQTAMLTKLHARGLTNDQVRGVLADYAETQGGAWQTSQASAAKFADQAEGELRRDWGKAYDANVEFANRAIRSAFGDDLPAMKHVRLADGTYLLDNPKIAKAFARLGESLGEDSDLAGARGNGGGGGMIRTPSQAKTEIDRIRAEAVVDPKHPYVNRSHPEFKAMQQRMNELHSLAFTGGN